jgi:hypothetical protein
LILKEEKLNIKKIKMIKMQNLKMIKRIEYLKEEEIIRWFIIVYNQ